MKNRILFLMAICIGGCMSLFGENDNGKVIKQSTATFSDYSSLLKESGYEVFPFDISSLSDGQYHITFKIKEYKDGKKASDDFLGVNLTFRNMTLVSDFSKKDQESIKPEEMDVPERGIYKWGKKIVVGFTPAPNDSIRPMLLEIENMGACNARLPMLPQYENNDSIKGKKLYMYITRPFKQQELKTGQFIPLVMYGSFWYDKKFGIHRCCGESVIDSDMSSEILKYIPHYYIIGIEVSEPTKKI